MASSSGSRAVSVATVASERGAAVGIGHPYPETLEILEEWVPQAVARGFRFVTVSELVK